MLKTNPRLLGVHTHKIQRDGRGWRVVPSAGFDSGLVNEQMRDEKWERYTQHYSHIFFRVFWSLWETRMVNPGSRFAVYVPPPKQRKVKTEKKRLSARKKKDAGPCAAATRDSARQRNVPKPHKGGLLQPAPPSSAPHPLEILDHDSLGPKKPRDFWREMLHGISRSLKATRDESFRRAGHECWGLPSDSLDALTLLCGGFFLSWAWLVFYPE